MACLYVSCSLCVAFGVGKSVIVLSVCYIYIWVSFVDGYSCREEHISLSAWMPHEDRAWSVCMREFMRIAHAERRYFTNLQIYKFTNRVARRPLIGDYR